MLRTCVSRCNSLSPAFASTSWLHTSAPRLDLRKIQRKKGKLTRKDKEVVKEARYTREVGNRPSPITGVPVGQEHRWFDCDLAKVLVRPDELNAPSNSVVQQDVGEVTVPNRLAYGLSNVQSQESRVLFGHLPLVSSMTDGLGINDERELVMRTEQGKARELLKANQFAKLVDLRNADADGIAYENRRRIIAAFSTPENPFDTGRSEVQAALLTYKIRNMWDHLTTNKRDVNNRQGLLKLIHQRAKVLKYLKRTQRVRYDNVLGRLCLEPRAVEGELIL